MGMNRYPGAVAGAVAASAPILAFPGMSPPWDTNSYWQVVTRDATPAAGAAAGCESNVRDAFAAVWRIGKTASGRALLSKTLRLCGADPVATEADVSRVAMMLLNACVESSQIIVFVPLFVCLMFVCSHAL
jgi:lysosomal Pro-X carboxypeptidase